jgi:large subunit ribosomal protein L25
MAQQRFSISAEPRTILGKKVKQLRRNGLIPANIYGHNVDSTPVSVAVAEFLRVYKQAGETGLIDLSIGKEITRPVLVHAMLEDPASGALLHVDFYQVNLKEKLITAVPIEFVGESPIVKTKGGILLELLQEVEVECLPTEIPHSFAVDISGLTEVDQGIHVKDLPLPAGVEMQTDGDELVCKIDTAQMSEETVSDMSTAESLAEGETENETPAAADEA